MNDLNSKQIIEALERCLTLEYGVACKGCPLSYNDERRTDCLETLMKNALALINSQEQKIKELTEENKKLEYTLEGVMHSVDKWLDGAELEQDEVNRAITMREKTLQIVEKLTEENERLRANAKSATEILNFKFAYDAGKADTVRKMQALIAKESSWFVTMSNGIVTKRTYQITEDALGKIADKIITEVVKNA